MKTPFKNIQQVLRYNRIVVLALVVMAGLVCITAIVLVVKIHKDSLNQAFVVSSDGAVIPLQLTNERENLEVEALAHLEQFHNWFYGVEANSYEKNMEKPYGWAMPQ